MACQRLHSSQADGVPCDLEPPQELVSGVLASIEFEREEGPREAALRIPDPDLFLVSEERRIPHPLELRMPGQVLRYPLRILALTIQPDRLGRQAAVEHPAFISLQNVAQNRPRAPEL